MVVGWTRKIKDNCGVFRDVSATGFLFTPVQTAGLNVRVFLMLLEMSSVDNVSMNTSVCVSSSVHYVTEVDVYV